MKTKLKIIITAVLCIVCILPVFTVFAKDNDYSVKQVDGFTVGYTGSSLKDVAKIMNLNEKELEKMCRENHTLFVAVNSDNSVQVRLSRYQTEVSKMAEDISSLSDSLQGELIGAEDGEYVKVKIGNTTFLKIKDYLLDDGGKYTSQQYITIKNGYVYHISAYISDKADESAAEEFVNGINIVGATVYSPKQKILVACGIGVFVILIIIMIIGIIKDLRE